MMDEYRPFIEGYLNEDEGDRHKQRHTAKKIFERLRDEHGCTASEPTVRRCVAKVRVERPRSGKEQYLTLVWARRCATSAPTRSPIAAMSLRAALAPAMGERHLAPDRAIAEPGKAKAVDAGAACGPWTP